MIRAFHHVALKASDFEKSVAFYRDIIGLKPCAAWGEGDGRGIMLALDDDSRIEIFAGGKKNATQGQFIHIAFRVTEPDSWIEKIRAAGYGIKSEPADCDVTGTPGFRARLAFAYGPDGEEIEFFAPVE